MRTKARILITDDDAGIRDLLRDQIEAAGFETRVARDGHEALERISSFRPDGMVLDISMPGLDGFGVLRSLQGRAIRLPVLVLTARHVASDVRRAVSLGARDYLTKPFTEAQVKARIARLLRVPIPPVPVSGTLFV
ncbi:response regulator [Brevundimonas sp.]|uniref:response regulator transcription factor n=1 Tax=Brevundimonas sp. TaxID=1871086 RepID=UPI00286B3512|nr:response regulator [Brevundimonas sp.]